MTLHLNNDPRHPSHLGQAKANCDVVGEFKNLADKHNSFIWQSSVHIKEKFSEKENLGLMYMSSLQKHFM